MADVSIRVDGEQVIINRRTSLYGCGFSVDLKDVSIRDILNLLKEKIKSCILK